MKNAQFRQAAPFIAFLLLAVCLFAANPFSRISYALQDLLYQMPGRVMEGLYLLPSGDIPAGDAALRQETARIISALNADPENRPAVIGVDIPFFGRSDSEADEALAQAVSRADNVVLPSLLHYDHQIIHDRNRFVLSGTSISGIQEPVPPLDTAAPNGFRSMFLDSDGRIRHAMLGAEYEGEAYTHFAYAIYKKYMAFLNREAVPPPTDRDGIWYVDFSGKPGAYDPGITWNDILDGHVPAASFKDAIILLRASTDNTVLRTPLGKESSTEVCANMVQAMADGVHKRHVPFLIQAALLILLLLGCRAGFKRGNLTAALALAGGLILWPLFCAAAYHLFGLVLIPLYPPLFVLALFAYHLACDWAVEFYGRIRVRQTLRRYLSPATANRLLTNHVSLEKPEKREIAVLFVDIRGFTPLSESLSPGQLAEVLREYLTLTSSAIFNNGGTLDKFIGDATMGFFNAPLKQDDFVYCAVKAALEIAAGGEKLRETFQKRFDRSISFGIGVHFGNAVVGEIGPDYRKDYTAVGDTVNTASRLESNAKPGEVLVSLKVCEALQGRIKASFAGERQIKGKSKPMLLYRVDALKGVTMESPASAPAKISKPKPGMRPGP